MALRKYTIIMEVEEFDEALTWLDATVDEDSDLDEAGNSLYWALQYAHYEEVDDE